VEMETFGIAQVAVERGIPLHSLRSISDSPEEPIPFTMGGGEDFHLKPLTLLGAVLRNPRIIGPLLRLKNNSAKAAGNLAAVVFAILAHV
ncbi:MAG: phosphorylase, partial [Spirochaetia bacterium]